MKIGVFDSGLGGLVMTKAVFGPLGHYDFAYLGDTAYLPYGARSKEKIYERTRKGVDWLMRVKDAALVIIACNTASIAALQRIQREWLPANFPDRRVLGIVVPTIEEAADANNIGLIGTVSTVASGVYESELLKIAPNRRFRAVATPLLVPLIENGGDKYAKEIISDYLAPIADVETLVLGCTHYPVYKGLIRRILPRARIISQDEVLPPKLADYLRRHPEIEGRLSRGAGRFFGITDMTRGYIAAAEQLFGRAIEIERVDI
ncbi:MAG: glutamate racemase [Alphaproteobacteria bacterium]|nr:glutamate racemase [Alphaproteobacteria bacterium]